MNKPCPIEWPTCHPYFENDEEPCPVCGGLGYTVEVEAVFRAYRRADLREDLRAFFVGLVWGVLAGAVVWSVWWYL